MWRRILFATLWAVTFTTMLAPPLAYSAEKPEFSIDLLPLGLPPKFFTERCITPYLKYTAVRWLDEDRVLVAFSTNPACTKDDTSEREVDGKLRLALFDLQGRLLRTTDLDYDAAIDEVMLHDGIWIFPKRTILVEVPFVPASKRPSGRGKVLVLTEDLQTIQQIDTQSNETAYRPKNSTNYGLNFAGVRASGDAAVFWTETPKIGRKKCLLFSGSPLRQTAACSDDVLEKTENQFEEPGPYRVPRAHEIKDIPGASRDGARASVFVTKEENGFCQLAGAFCPSHGYLIVYETKSSRVVFRKSFSVDFETALSPDGQHVAAFVKNSLEIYKLPEHILPRHEIVSGPPDLTTRQPKAP